MILALGVISYVTWTANVSIIKAQTEERLGQLALDTMDKIDRMLYERVNDLREITLDPVISSPGSTADEISQRLTKFGGIYSTFISLSFFNLNHVRIADTAGIDIGAKDAAHAYWHDVLQGKLSGGSSIDLSRSLNENAIYFATPVKTENGKIFGYVVARIALKKLYEIVHKMTAADPLTKNLRIELLNKNGVIIFSNYNQDAILKDKATPFVLNEIKKMPADKMTWISENHYHGTEKFFDVFAREKGYLNFKGNNWVLVIHAPEKLVIAPIIALREKTIFVTITSVLCAIFLSLILAFKFSRPITELIKVIVAFGRGNLDARVLVKSRDEIGELGNAFNQMAEELKRTTTSIDDLNKEIAERKRIESQLKESEEKFRILYDSSGDAIMTLSPPDWFFTDANPATVRLFNTKDKAAFCSLRPWDISPEYQPDGRLSSEKAEAMIIHAMESGSNFFEWTHNQFQGESFPATVLLTKVSISGKTFLQATVRNIAETKKAQEALKKSKENLHGIISMNADPILILNSDGVVKYANFSAERLFGRRLEKITGKNLGVPMVNAEFIEIDILRPGKEPSVGELFTSKTEWEGEDAYLIMIRDITDHKELEKKLLEKSDELSRLNHALEVMATHDLLTELPNRRFFEDVMLKIISNSERHHKKFALMLIDINEFKNINDTFGHDVGDKTLKRLSTVLKKCVRKEDVVARLGGDEFVVILHEADNYGAVATVANKMISTFNQPINFSMAVTYSSISIGITFYPSLATDAEKLLKQADIAMYEAKRKGKGSGFFEIYQHEAEKK